MFKNIQKLLTNNLGWKLFSIIGAIILWILVINIINPLETRSFTTTVRFENEETLNKRDLVIANKNDIEDLKISVKVKGKKTALDTLEKNQNRIKATINLQSSIYGITISDPNYIPIRIDYSGTDTFSTDSISPETVRVIFEEIETVTKEIQVKTIGEPENGFVTLPAEITPSTVEVKGASSLIAKLDSVKVPIDITGISESLEAKGTLEAYDSSGNIIDGLQLNISEANVKLPINKYKKVPIRATYEGIQEDGYRFTGADLSMDYVEVVGDKESIDNFNELVLEKINISGFNKTETRTYDLRKFLPTNIDIKNGTPNEVTVTINISKEETKQFNVPVSNIIVIGASTNQLSFNQENISINLNGISSTINNLKLSDIRCSIDLNGYGIGNHNVPVKISVPSGIKLIESEVSVNVTINSTPQVPNSSQSTESSTQEEGTSTEKTEQTSEETESSSEAESLPSQEQTEETTDVFLESTQQQTEASTEETQALQ